MAASIPSMPPSSWLSAFLRKRLGNSGTDLRGRGLSTEIRRLDLALREHAADRRDDAIVRGALAEVIEHHRARPDRADRVRDSLARDIGRRAVNRFEHRWSRPLGIDVAAWRDAQA